MNRSMLECCRAGATAHAAVTAMAAMAAMVTTAANRWMTGTIYAFVHRGHTPQSQTDREPDRAIQ